MPRRIELKNRNGGDQKLSNSAQEKKNGQPENAPRKRMDPKVLSLIRSLVQTNVPKRIQKEQLFVTLNSNDKESSPISMEEQDQNGGKKDTHDQLPPVEKGPESPSANIQSASSMESKNLQTKRRPTTDVEDLRHVLNRRQKSKDGGAQTGDPEATNAGSQDSEGIGGGGSSAKRFCPSPESDSESDTSQSEPSTTPKVKSQICVVRHVRKRSPSPSDERESRFEKRKGSQRLVLSEPSSSSQRHRHRIVKSEDEESPSRSQQPISDEQFTFFFTRRYVFSNHYPCVFTIGDNEYCCTEQYYMYKKADHFGDTETANMIMGTTDASQIKRFGASSNIRGFDVEEWDKEDVGRRYMREGNLAKYQQNSDLRAELLNTRGTTLVEANPHDPKWGIGLSMTDPERFSRRNWRGQNWLGQILTQIRDEFLETHDSDTD